jgi:hypothetical protein
MSSVLAGAAEIIVSKCQLTDSRNEYTPFSFLLRSSATILTVDTAGIGQSILVFGEAVLLSQTVWHLEMDRKISGILPGR